MKFRFFKRPRVNGFALIATLMMLILLLLLAVGIQSVSAITLRSAKQSDAMMEARANAKLGLLIAIGELQKQMGPDQRISANSSIRSETAVKNPHWMGVWDSWIAGDPDDAPVKSDYPSGESHHRTIGSQAEATMRPDYANKDRHFREWMLSLTEEEAADPLAAENVTLDAKALPAELAEAVLLVGPGSLGETAVSTEYVGARLMKIMDDEDIGRVKGRYGWWVGDESQKARVMHDSYNKTTTLTAAERIYRSQAPGSTGTKSITGLEDLTVAQELKLEALPSMKTLDLLPEDESSEPAKKNFHSITPFSQNVLADVREGGLKRDLSVLLERPVSRTETGDEFMLYKFNIKDTWANNPSYNLPNTPQECVPIQDLAAFYQLYDQSRKGGIEYNSADIKTTSPNYGTTAPLGVTDDYSGMYRQPVPVKIQFVLSLAAEPITAADRALTHTYDPDGGGPLPPVTTTLNLSIPATDTHKMRLAVIPVVTMWNPYNVPITMQTGAASQELQVRPPSFYIGCVKTRSTGEQFTARELNLTFARVGNSQTGGQAQARAYLMRLYFGRTGPAVTFKPGEVRVFSLPIVPPSENLKQYGMWDVAEATPGWNSTGLYTFKHSTPLLGNRNRTVPVTNLTSGECNIVFEGNQGANTSRFSISLAAGDSLAFTINAAPPTLPANNVTNPAREVAPAGSAMTYYMIRGIGANPYYSYINLFNNSFVTRFGRDASYPAPFINELMRQGIPGGATSYAVEEIQASQVINASGGSTVPLMQFALMAGCEVSESIGEFGGRKHPMRPFLHSSTLAPTVVDKSDATAPYLHGWNWWLEDISSILGALVNNTQNGQGYFGGGYTPEGGVSQVIQQEIPVTPPISIAALSHARLGGFTLANEAPTGQGKTGTVSMEGYGYDVNGSLSNPTTTLGFQRVTASGQGGLYPNTLQAIGNSYAHPMLEPNKAFNDDYERIMDADDGPRKVVFADHSYLANKALWDDYFFSSISPQPSTIPIFGGTSRTAKQVAQDFFFGTTVKPLPNRRITPYLNGLDTAKLDSLFTEATLYQNGLADKIAGHLMVEGAFNVNSTSVEAWKIFLSSMKGKPVAYLNGGTVPQEQSTVGTPVSGFTLPTAAPLTAEINDSKSPAEQWLGTRELTDEEIDELANAMVKQVKLRGPFLSLSEFVNRRLETTTSAEDPPNNLAVMGALQAALDDPSVSINQPFRDDPFRMLDSETDSLNFPFKAAAKGPAAYGSAAYIDQADILRQLGSQLTPRGDTFVIRTYGDALDSKGKVVARAWCEAVVQRVPEYLDATDNSHLKSSDLQSDANKRFGRKFVLTKFRWLNSSEV